MQGAIKSRELNSSLFYSSSAVSIFWARMVDCASTARRRGVAAALLRREPRATLPRGVYSPSEPSSSSPFLRDVVVSCRARIGVPVSLALVAVDGRRLCVD